MNCACWNIRGLNETSKHGEVRKIIFEQKLDILGLVETKVKSVNKNRIIQGVFRDWNCLANYDSHNFGRIWIGWNPDNVELSKFSESDQVVYCKIKHLESRVQFTASFVYGFNDDRERRPLWSNLIYHARIFSNEPWVVLGDFNAIRSLQENEGGQKRWNSAMEEFDRCLQDSEFIDLRYLGIQFTWRNKRGGHGCVVRMLDRVLVNERWHLTFQQAMAEFLPLGVSDHSPIVVHLGLQVERRKPFQIF